MRVSADNFYFNNLLEIKRWLNDMDDDTLEALTPNHGDWFQIGIVERYLNDGKPIWFASLQEYTGV